MTPFTFHQHKQLGPSTSSLGGAVIYTTGSTKKTTVSVLVDVAQVVAQCDVRSQCPPLCRKH